MSHCTKFEFTYTKEEAIVKAFGKLGLIPTTGLVAEFNSEFSKKVLTKLGYMGKRQYRAICACTENNFKFFLCKVEDNAYMLLIESAYPSAGDEIEIANLASQFQKAYVSVAIDETVRRIDSSGIPTRVIDLHEGYKIEFGPSFEYSIYITLSGDEVTEEVRGVKGDICLKLTEELELLLASPTANLVTEWKPEYSVVHEEQTLQILSANL